MSYTDVDRVNGRTIRKLHSPDKTKTFGFLSGVKDPATNNLSEVVKHGTMTEAREYCGFRHNGVKFTAPKSSYAQNRPGYDPHAR